MNYRKGILLLALIIVIIASFMRLYNLDSLPPGIYPDEAMNGNNALEALSHGTWKWFYPENNGREAFFINLQAISVFVFGNEPWALRLVSTLFGILTVLGVFLLTRELFYNLKEPISSHELSFSKNRKISLSLSRADIIAFLSAFFIATSFWHINFSRIGFRAIMAPFFFTWSLYFFMRAANNKKFLLPLGLSGLFLGLGMHSYIAFRAMPAVMVIGFFLWLFSKSRQAPAVRLFTGFTLLVAVAILAFSPLALYFIKNPQDFMGRTSQVSVFSSATPLKDLSLNIIKTAGMFFVAGDYNWRHNLSGAPQLFYPVAFFFLLGTALAVKSLIKRENSLAFILIFSWLAVAAAPVVISNEGIPHALRAIIMIPPVFILSGLGAFALYSFLKERLSEKFLPALNYASAALLILVFAYGFFAYFFLWGKSPHTQGAFAQNYVDIGRLLNALPKETPKYVIVKAGGTDVRGIPMPSQTVMFITDTFTPDKQKEKNIFYVLPENSKDIPVGSFTVNIE